MINKRLDQIISKCQELRHKYGFYYEDKCAAKIRRYSDEIISKNLIEKSEDKDFAMQLCMMNSLNYTTPRS